MKFLYLTIATTLYALTSLGQVQFDKSIELIGNGTDAKVSGIKSATNAQDATSVEALQNGSFIYGTASGTGGNYVVTLSPPIAAYKPGMVVNFKANTGNSGAATVNVNGLGITTIKKAFNSDLATGDIVAGQIVSVIYDDNNNFQLLSRSASSGGSACATLELPVAGSDITAINGSTIQLSGNAPIAASGTWSVFSGTGGSFLNSSSPTSTFTGQSGSNYTLAWTFTAAGCPTVSSYLKLTFLTANYASGNAAYWTEKTNGFRPVTIGTDPTVFTYDATNKQYKNGAGTLILLPTVSRAGSPQPETVSSTNFYGYSGSSASDNNFQWDAQTTISSVYDIGKVFVSPVSASGMSYCKMLQNSYSGSCNSSSSSIMYASGGLCYGTTPSGTGPYSAYSGQDLTPSTTLNASFTTRRFSQQAMNSDGMNDSYCVATYGKGWRVPTDIEVGHPDNTVDNGTVTLNTGYLGTSGLQMWTSSKACNGGGCDWDYLRYAWRLDNSSSTWPWGNGHLDIGSFQNNVRCIYTGGN